MSGPEVAGAQAPARRVRGHRLETISTRPGLVMAGCSCGTTYRPTHNGQVWQSWQRDRIRAAHQEHLGSL